jgi:hypothetical protein
VKIVTSHLNIKETTINKTEKGTLYIRGVPKNLKDFFKAACAKRGIAMTEKIIDMMKEYVAKENKEKK